MCSEIHRPAETVTKKVRTVRALSDGEKMMKEEKDSSLEQGGNGTENLENEETCEAAENAAEGAGTDSGAEAGAPCGEASGEEPECAAGEEETPAEKEQELSRSERKALEKKDEEIAAMKDRYMRTLAEYENYRKRTEKEKADLYSYAVKDVMTKILPVLDNLERGLSGIPEEKRKDPVAEGMDKICKQFVKALEDIGVKPIEAEGKEFDLNLHNAVMHVEDDSFGENIVAEELQKGYTYRDTVIRHSMVKVAN